MPEWLAYLYRHRRPTPLPTSTPRTGPRCPLTFCGGRCRYDLTSRRGVIDGRCLTKAAALAKEN